MGDFCILIQDEKDGLGEMTPAAGPRLQVDLTQVFRDIGEIKASQAIVIKAINGNGQPGLLDRVTRLEESDSTIELLKPHIKSIVRMGVLVFLALTVLAYGMVWAVAHQWPKLP